MYLWSAKLLGSHLLRSLLFQAACLKVQAPLVRGTGFINRLKKENQSISAASLESIGNKTKILLRLPGAPRCVNQEG